MSKILYLDEARSHTLSAGPSHLLRLNPGRNVVEDEVFEEVLKARGKDKKGKPNPSSALEDLIEEGKVKVVGETLDITTMTVNEALDFVEKEATEEGLLDLMEQESGKKKPRKQVVKAIEGLLDQIQNPPPPPGDE